MGYKRCLDVNEFEDLSLNKAKRLESDNQLVSLTGNSFVKTVMSGDNEGGFYNIQWHDAIQANTAFEAPPSGDRNVQTSGPIGSWSSDYDSGSGATSLSSASSGCLEFDIPKKSYDDMYSSLDCSPIKSVPVGPNHQAVLPVWSGKMNKISKLAVYNDDIPFSGLASIHTAHDNEERLMGTSVLPMPDSSFYSNKGNEGGEGRSECNCLDQGSIRCVRQHVREARENVRSTLGMENFVNLGFCDMGEYVALKWNEEEEEVFHEVVYTNPASLGRNFWKHLSAAFPHRTNKEIVSYYFNVFMLRRRAAQNRSRFLDIDSDDDECHTSDTQFYGYENSEDDSGIESLGDVDGRVENQDYSDEDDGNEFAGYNMGNISKEEGEIDQRSSKCKANSQFDSWNNPSQHLDGTRGILKDNYGAKDDSCMSLECEIYQRSSNCKANSQFDSWSNPCQHLDGTRGILKDDYGAKDDSCMSFECDVKMDVSRCHGFLDASKEIKCDQCPRVPSKLGMPSHEIENFYLLEPGVSKDWYPGYSTFLDTNIDFLPTSNLIDEFFGLGTPDRKTRSD
ncbi:hypothetical protein Lal_00026620 [Lupinus albus]|uniref:Putative transcription factor MYB family n=1 Tax=Lupinus albus TaxID=3870 RepID=A0A6A5LQN0_LUPAL|nr:putative transcription factor MYB family [Lupinus albus]KAF1862103.1 hypothetical protein Lal_00026620 [Lupinus albus]